MLLARASGGVGLVVEQINYLIVALSAKVELGRKVLYPRYPRVLLLWLMTQGRALEYALRAPSTWCK